MGKAKFCSPNNRNNKVSCFSNNSLIKIATQYNEKYENKITIPTNLSEKNKVEFWKTLRDKINMKTGCKEEHCWLNLDFVNRINDKYINTSFRPVKPLEWKNKPKTWLTTTEIDRVLEQYQEKHLDFKYIGAVPMDFDKELGVGMCVVDELCKLDLKKLYFNGIRKLGVVFNLDPHDKPGSHWVSMFADLNNGGIYYFDSYAKPPSLEVRNLLERIRTQGNKMIEDRIINFGNFRDEHEVKIKFKVKSNNELIINNGVDIQLDTPSVIENNKNTSNNFLKIIDEKLSGGDDNTYKIVKLNKNININKNDGNILVQRGFRKFYNNIRFQYEGSECGVYSIHFQTELLDGKKFVDVIKNIIDDNTMNKQRDYYFRPT